MHVYGEIHGTLTGSGVVSGFLSAEGNISGVLTIPSEVGSLPYSGPYEFTPSQETQEIEIEGMRAAQNITINPIPNNYGLITYNGSTITVS